MTQDDGRTVRISPRIEKIAELTRTQSDIWTSQRLHPDTPLANMGKRTRIEGHLDPKRLVRAFDVVVRRCEALRTVVADRPSHAPQRSKREGAVAVVRALPPASTEVIDLPAIELDAWCADRISVPIDATACVYDSVLLRHADDDWTWWLDLHHIATDAWSSALIFEATSAAYADGGDDIDLSSIIDGSFYGDHTPPTAAADGLGTDRETAWREEVDSAGPQPPLEPYGARGPRTTRVRRLAMPLGPDDRQGLQAALDSVYRTISRELGLLTIAAMSTAIAVHRLDGRSSVVLGVPVHHRSARDARRLVGPLMELYPLTVSVEPSETHAEMFKRVLASVVTLLRRAKPGESPAARFEIVLNVLTARYGHFADMPATSEWMRSGHVDPGHLLRSQIFDYTADSSTMPGLAHLQWELDVNSALSADESSGRFPEHLAAVVRHVTGAPDDSVGARSIVGDAERAELEALTPDPVPRLHTEPVHEQIAVRLRARPSWIVAEHDGERLSAAEFDRHADQVAHWLLAAGVSSGRAVGIQMPRSFDALIAMHGVLRAGGAFVMLSPEDPPARLASISADADLLLTLQQLPEPSPSDAERTLPTVDVDDRAYVLYTSGSTGEPKGVPVSHRGLADYLEFAVESYVEGPPVVALHSSLSVDLTITSLFVSFLTNGLTVIFDAEPITALAQIADDDRITFLKATPSQLELFVRLVDEPRPLQTIVVGGEAFRTSIARRTADSCTSEVRIYNEYGPTEAVVGCMIHRWDPDLDHDADVPIGNAAPGSRIALLDRFGHPTPTGAWGELYVRRPGMAQEYLGRPTLSAERFVTLTGVADPTEALDDDAGRWYRTGDRARV
ncbi:MAG: AMP-binding protein, partial [Acidimicrobiia bacterium]|nr:AMP-binding protein [Acidimicrobiia bacterium]